jgi:hypothetical protein
MIDYLSELFARLGDCLIEKHYLKFAIPLSVIAIVLLIVFGHPTSIKEVITFLVCGTIAGFFAPFFIVMNVGAIVGVLVGIMWCLQHPIKAIKGVFPLLVVAGFFIGIIVVATPGSCDRDKRYARIKELEKALNEEHAAILESANAIYEIAIKKDTGDFLTIEEEAGHISSVIEEDDYEVSSMLEDIKDAEFP